MSGLGIQIVRYEGKSAKSKAILQKNVQRSLRSVEKCQ